LHTQVAVAAVRLQVLVLVVLAAAVLAAQLALERLAR
jgi:hypothetical protein